MNNPVYDVLGGMIGGDKVGGLNTPVQDGAGCGRLG